MIEDLTPLAALRDLNYLDLSENDIDDVTPLADLLELTELELSHNAISDAAPLAHLWQLRSLNLSNNAIESLPGSLLDLPLDWLLEEDALEGLLLADNPLRQPPEKTIKKGLEAIEQYYERQSLKKSK